jgi:hypothetical protein
VNWTRDPQIGALVSQVDRTSYAGIGIRCVRFPPWIQTEAAAQVPDLVGERARMFDIRLTKPEDDQSAGLAGLFFYSFTLISRLFEREQASSNNPGTARPASGLDRAGMGACTAQSKSAAVHESPAIPGRSLSRVSSTSQELAQPVHVVRYFVRVQVPWRDAGQKGPIETKTLLNGQFWQF